MPTHSPDPADYELPLAEGDLPAALDAVTDWLQAHPTDDAARAVRIALLIAADDFEEAANEVYTRRHQVPEFAAVADDMLGLLDAAEQRADFMMAGDGAPSGLRPPPACAGDFLDAIAGFADDDLEAAIAALNAGYDAVTDCAAIVDGSPVTDFRDVDDALGPFLEALIPGQYLWIPFADIAAIEFAPTAEMLDEIWRPATVDLRDGQTGEVWIPAVYAGSGAGAGPLALGRLIEFEFPAEDVRRALGQRHFRTTTAERPDEFSVVSMRVCKRIEFR